MENSSGQSLRSGGLPAAAPEEEVLSHRESRGQRLRFALALALPFVLLAGGLLWRVTWHGDPSNIVLATGARSGTYFPYGEALGQIVEDGIPGVSVEVLETGGSLANADLLAEGRAQFAFLQSNVLSKAFDTEENEESQRTKRSRSSLHPGAAHFYARNDPPFLVTYAESISLLVTLLLTASSGLFAFREWMKRRRKNRIDIYYLNLEELSRRIRRTRNLEELSQLREDLYRLRRRAFHELVAERIAADESFTIFQDFLGQELREVDRWLDRGGSPGQARKRSG